MSPTICFHHSNQYILVELFNILNYTLRPVLSLETQFDGGISPVLSVVVHATVTQPSSVQALLLGQNSEYTEDYRHTGINLDTHQSVSHGIRDVLEVLRCSLDENTNGYHGIEWAG